MLDAYIIDAIRNDELEREFELERRRVWLELPLPPPPNQERDPEEATEDPVVIPLTPEMGIRPDRNEEDAA